MPAFTSFLNLYKPGGGSTGLILPDEVVDIDRLNANADAIDAFAAGWGKAAERNHQLYGPTAALSGVTGMKLGDTYQESDALKRIFRFDGTSWVLYSSGAVNLTYSPGWSNASQQGTFQVTNGMVSFNGRVNAASGVGGDTMFVLPPEARPEAQRVSTVSDGTTWRDLVIDTNGAVNQFGRGSSARSDIRLATIPPFPAKMF